MQMILLFRRTADQYYFVIFRDYLFKVSWPTITGVYSLSLSLSLSLFCALVEHATSPPANWWAQTQAVLLSDHPGDRHETIKKVLQENLCNLNFKAVAHPFETGLFLKESGNLVDGSGKKRWALLQDGDFLVSDEALDCPDQAVSDILSSLQQMPQMTKYVRETMDPPLKGLMKLAWSADGPDGFAKVLADFGIHDVVGTQTCIGIGDSWPGELREILNQSMMVTFEAL